MSEPWPPVTDVEIDPNNPAEVAVSVGGRYAFGMPLHQAREIRDGLNKLDLEDSTLCTCAECMPDFWGFRICSLCGNKRCPHNFNHENACTRSNEPGQPGAPAYPTKPFALADLPYNKQARGSSGD